MKKKAILITLKKNTNVNTCATQVLSNNRIHSYSQTHSFNKCCLFIYYMLGTIPSIGNTATLLELTLWENKESTRSKQTRKITDGCVRVTWVVLYTRGKEGRHFLLSHSRTEMWITRSQSREGEGRVFHAEGTVGAKALFAKSRNVTVARILKGRV